MDARRHPDAQLKISLSSWMSACEGNVLRPAAVELINIPPLMRFQLIFTIHSHRQDCKLDNGPRTRYQVWLYDVRSRWYCGKCGALAVRRQIIDRCIVYLLFHDIFHVHVFTCSISLIFERSKVMMILGNSFLFNHFCILVSLGFLNSSWTT